jgi:hypothetical protein
MAGSGPVIAAIAILATLIAEGLTIGVFATLIGSGIGWWGFAGIVLAGYYLPRFVGGFNFQDRRAYAATGVAGLLLIYLVLRIEIAGDVAFWNFSWVADFMRDGSDTLERGGRGLLGAVLLLVAWARGTIRGSDDMEMEWVARSLAIPFGIVIAAVILGAPTDRAGDVGRTAAGFFGVAVVALAASQLALSGTTIGELRAGGITAVLLAGTVVVAGVGFLVFGVLAGIVGPVVGPVIMAVLERVLTILLTPPAWLLSQIFQRLFSVTNFPDIAEAPQRLTDGSPSEPGEQSILERGGIFGLRILALLTFIGIVAGFVMLYLRLKRRALNQRALDGESGTAGSALGDLRGLLRSFIPHRGGGEHLRGESDATRLYIEVLERQSARVTREPTAIPPGSSRPS